MASRRGGGFYFQVQRDRDVLLGQSEAHEVAAHADGVSELLADRAGEFELPR